MNQELQQEFLDETIGGLTNLQYDLRNSETETLSEDFLRHLFRRIHSIKGTAQTFGLSKLSRFAHETENLLQAINLNKIAQSEETTLIIEESLTHLLKLCHDERQPIPAEFLNRINQLIPSETQETPPDILGGIIPPNVLSKLSEQETEKLKSAIADEKIFYLIEVFFPLAEFSAGFVEFRRILAESGEIIAVSPSDKADHAKEIGFCISFVSAKTSAEIKEIVSSFKAEIDYESATSREASNDLNGILSNLVADCRKKARILEKQVAFEISNQTNDIAKENLILINYLLLHLLRNAVDHAIESPSERIASKKSPKGKIKVEVFEADGHLFLRIEDDGRGIDAEKISAQAQKRGVITENQHLTKDETINLIFAHGFSTAEIVSDVSGRGVGLDIVKDLVEKAGGSIKVQTETARGTIFEIRLPR